MKAPCGLKALEHFPVGESFWSCLFVCSCNIFISSLLHVGVTSLIQEERIIVAREFMLGCILTKNINYVKMKGNTLERQLHFGTSWFCSLMQHSRKPSLWPQWPG